MAKLTALILFTVAVAATVASASAYNSDKCEQEVEMLMPLTSCMMWAESKIRRGTYAANPFLRSAVANRGYKEQHLNECCEELRQVSSECRCKAVKEMMMEMPQRQVEMQRMMCSLPTKCGMSSCACPRFFFDD